MYRVIPCAFFVVVLSSTCELIVIIVINQA